jgi:hypothetical protein
MCKGPVDIGFRKGIAPLQRSGNTGGGGENVETAELAVGGVAVVARMAPINQNTRFPTL